MKNEYQTCNEKDFFWDFAPTFVPKLVHYSVYPAIDYSFDFIFTKFDLPEILLLLSSLVIISLLKVTVNVF